MPTSGLSLPATPECVDEDEEEDAVAEPEVEPVEAAVALEAEVEAAELAAADEVAADDEEALREPHCSLSLQVCWP